MYEDLTEAQWRGVVVDLAAQLGWVAFYVDQSTREITRRDGRRARVRNVSMTGVGFPDLVLMHPRKLRLIFAELKRGPRKGGGQYDATEEQERWLDGLRRIADSILNPSRPIVVRVWRPKDYDRIVEELQ